MLLTRNTGWLSGFSLLMLSGCTSFALNAGFDNVKTEIEQRSAMKLFWNNGTDLDKEATEKVQSLLKGKLTSDGTVQVALLNNRELQATYSELGIAQADLVQAGLLKNPIFEAAVLYPAKGGGKPDLELSAVMNFLDILYLPLKKRVAEAGFAEAKSRVTGLVLDFAGRVRRGFYSYQANEQMLELRQTVVAALAASFEVSRRMYEAGNITDLEFARERALLEEGKLALRSAEVAARQNREELNVLMGLWGKDTEWEADSRLPDIPADPIPTQDIERQALSRSVDLVNARQRVLVAGNQFGFSRWTGFISELHAGPLGERNEGLWEVGPTLEFPIPLFDQGQARSGRAAAELRRSQQEYYALGVLIRSSARAARDRMEGARDRALYYRDILLPLRERIVNEAQLQYNAMQLGPFQLLRAREQQIEGGVAYVESLRDYWLARSDIAQILSGRLPAAGERPIGGKSGQTNANERDGH